MDKFYVIFIHGCVEPVSHGPYDTRESMVNRAIELSEDMNPDKDMIILQHIHPGGTSVVVAFEKEA